MIGLGLLIVVCSTISLPIINVVTNRPPTLPAFLLVVAVLSLICVVVGGIFWKRLGDSESPHPH